MGNCCSVDKSDAAHGISPPSPASTPRKQSIFDRFSSSISNSFSRDTDTPSQSQTGSLSEYGLTVKASSRLGYLSEEELYEAMKRFTITNTASSGYKELHLELLEHEHTEFCERRERVCDAHGKLREFQKIQAVTDENYTVDIENFVWARSKQGIAKEQVNTPSLAQFMAIPDSRGKSVYELTPEDIGSYIGLFRPEALSNTNVTPAWLQQGDGAASEEVTVSVTETEESIVSLGAFDEDDEIPIEGKGGDASSYMSAGVFLGPVDPSPPRFKNFRIVGRFTVGGHAMGTYDYVGGKMGLCEFSWMRIRQGVREDLGAPIAIDADQLKHPPTLDRNSGNVIYQGSDPRVRLLGEDDVGCTFKLKCRPVREDGYQGQIVTSKPSGKVSALV